MKERKCSMKINSILIEYDDYYNKWYKETHIAMENTTELLLLIYLVSVWRTKNAIRAFI